MQADRLPPGQPAGDGDGPGDGPGDGDGPKVEPIVPYLMLKYLTYASLAFFSTSSGLPESVEHDPRETPGAEGLLFNG